MEQRGPIYRGDFVPLRPPPLIPGGLKALYAACLAIYPEQSNPLQVAALVKYWLGGPDPLDYISMYSHPGDPARDIPAHWHYVSFGLSDLHGDGRVHPISPTHDGPSGYGFELTFRLKRSAQETAPPTWPAAILQALAKYVFQSENTLCAGDHVSWHCPLDNSSSRIQHMLMCEDPQLGTVQTPNGRVRFVQVVGVCSEELQAAQGWNGPGVVELLRGVLGPWLVTDMKRRETLFEADPAARARVDQGVEEDGSNLSGVSARCSWHPLEEDEADSLGRGFAKISVQESEAIKATLQKGLSGGPSSSSSQRYDLEAPPLDGNGNVEAESGAPLQTQTLEGVHLRFNLEAGTLLPLALRGRLLHGRHFTFKSVAGEVAITLVAKGVAGALVSEEKPLAGHGPWLQILLLEEDIEAALEDLKEVSETDALVLPKTFEWCGGRLLVTLMHEDF